jgi:tetratricopeptide (TPR) repeat protein
MWPPVFFPILAAADPAPAAAYCPPGAKYCPAPGADNSIYLDTHFGLDAQTNEIRAYRGTVHPDEIPNPRPAGETVLYAAPPLSVENRFVPNPNHPGLTEAMVRAGGRDRRNGALSEVSPQQTVRLAGERLIPEGERVPWWKGGLWRNRRGNRGGGNSAPAPGRAATAPPPPAADDFWNDEDYDGYNQPGSEAGGYYPSPDRSGSDPYAQGTAGFSGGMVGDPYTLPNSPPPTNPYPPGYAYPGTGYSYEANQPSGYAPQPDYSPYPAATSEDRFLPPPPQGGTATRPSIPAGGNPPPSPRFENAVGLVKDNRFGEARAILLEEASRQPSAAVWRWLGDCQYNLLELEPAIASYARALELDPNDYYALRGQGFALLHHGHEYWRKMQEEVARGNKEEGARIFSQAHENYKKALDQLGLCLRRAPNDGEAIYGEAMAAEGASRKLYSNAISFLKLGPERENRERAEVFAENCLDVINRGIARSRERARLSPGDSGPRALLGGLYLRKAILYQQLGKMDLALIELKSAHDVQQSILDEIDKNNATAQRSLRECEAYWNSWGGSRL